jgi:class 3 adenylate cyclase
VLVAILAADTLMAADGEAITRGLKGHQALVLPVIVFYAGRVTDTAVLDHYGCKPSGP